MRGALGPNVSDFPKQLDHYQINTEYEYGLRISQNLRGRKEGNKSRHGLIARIVPLLYPVLKHAYSAQWNLDYSPTWHHCEHSTSPTRISSIEGYAPALESQRNLRLLDANVLSQKYRWN
jgi:hypothetical protein